MKITSFLLEEGKQTIIFNNQIFSTVGGESNVFLNPLPVSYTRKPLSPSDTTVFLIFLIILILRLHDLAHFCVRLRLLLLVRAGWNVIQSFHYFWFFPVNFDQISSGLSFLVNFCYFSWCLISAYFYQMWSDLEGFCHFKSQWSDLVTFCR